MDSIHTGLLLLLVSNMILRSEQAQSTFNSSSDFEEEESDSVAYMIIVEHGEGQRCAGSLVSLRTALSSARCLRLSGPRATLWALAAALVVGHGTVRAADGARRVVRVAYAGTDSADPANDLALLAIDEPFGERAQSRPILMATAAGVCDAAADCNAVRALSRNNAHGVQALLLRVISVHRAPHAVCTAHVPHWASLKDRSLCLKGETLCENDMGGGVVCAGLLCGVLSVVGAREEDAKCGDTFGALTVARWRRFLHCAHTQRLCGRGDCASLCTEHWLDGSNEPFPVASLSSAFQNLVEDMDHALTAPVLSSLSYTKFERTSTELIVTDRNGGNTSSPMTPGRSTSSRAAVQASPRLQLLSRTPLIYELRPSADFEPNRADFKRSRVSLSTLALSSMRLKAGEYGDNAVDYGAPPDEALPSSSSLVSTLRRSVTIRHTIPGSASPYRHWVDPLAQPQTDTHKKKLKTSNASSTYDINLGILITIPTLVTINR
ncbi:uncharacterized protein LOC123713213 isoform X1 [Pieris brassicae]|uniref:uncharacterized protein LOC123713213 isoform X1 n=1 Tax=Pieris brassicae TaxID=7116 RepID=UPI001E65E46C|nr:uncharacterized protein LOC123713213 isoform X1 [Pieris brassicae]XP_045522732.1 uncharacterized protein LOC123713213 isoform X1 [Pieris brassicae]